MDDRETRANHTGRSWRLFLCVGLMVALADCANTAGLHPQSSMLTTESLAMPRSMAGMVTDSSAWPARDWWTQLGDPQLSALIDEAMAGNADLAAAGARTRAALAFVEAANAQRQPAVDGNAALAGERQSPSVQPEEWGGGSFIWSRSLNLSLSWGLDLWGGRRASWQAALGEARVAQIEGGAFRVQLSTNVGRAYAQLGYAFAELDIAHAEQVRTNQFLSLVARRLAKGIDGELPRKQAESDAATARRQVLAAERAVTAARITLAELLGRGPDGAAEINRPHLLPPEPFVIPADLPSELLGHRADLLAARWQIETANQQIVASKARFLPNVSLAALIGFAAQGGDSLFAWANREYQVAPAVSLPIFDADRRRADLAQQDARYDQAVAHYNRTLIHALSEIADRLDASRSLAKQVDEQQHALALARASWEYAQLRYRSGIGSYLEVLAAQRPLLGAEQTLALLNLQQIDTTMQFIAALGGGFQPQSDDSHFGASDPISESKVHP